jgi:hypothetical protein
MHCQRERERAPCWRVSPASEPLTRWTSKSSRDSRAGARELHKQRVAGAGADAKRGVPGFCSHPQQPSLSAAAHDYFGQPDVARLANALATEERSRRDNAGD